MREIIYKCDICGKQFDAEEMLHTASGKDLCEECLEKIVDKYFAQQETRF